MIAYDDQAAYRRAVRMLANAFCGDTQASDVRPLPWRFDEVALEPWRKHALADAKRADVFVVATTTELPATAREWLQDCFAFRREQPTAVVMLSDPNLTHNQPEPLCRRFVREAAAVAGIDFLEPHLAPAAV